MDILVVFGDLKEEQYQHVCLDMRKQGLEPKVVHVTDKYPLEINFVYEAEKTLGINRIQAWMMIDELTGAYLKDAFDRSSLSDVKAFIVPWSGNEYDEDNWEWVITRFGAGIKSGAVTQYTVYSGTDGSFSIEKASVLQLETVSSA